MNNSSDALETEPTPILIEDVENNNSSIDQEKTELNDEEIKNLVKEFFHVVSNKISTAIMYPDLARSHPDDPEIKDIGLFAAEDLKIALNWIQNFIVFVELNSNFKSFITVDQLAEIGELISKSLTNIENNDYASSDIAVQESAFKNIKELQFKYDSTKIDAIKDGVIAKDLGDKEEPLEKPTIQSEESVN